jgi:hypothetical protein
MAQGFNTVFENPFLPNIGGAQAYSIHFSEDTLYIGGIIVQEDQRGIGIFLKYDLSGNCLDTTRIFAHNDSMSVNLGRVSGTWMNSNGIVSPIIEFVLNGSHGNLNGDSLALFSRSGQVLWKTSLHVETVGKEIFHQVRPSSDGYYVIGSVSDSLGALSPHNVQGLLIRTDNEGNMLWHQRFPQVGEFNNIIVLENDDVILGGYTWNSSNGVGTNQLILKADSQGNEQWRYDFGGDYHDGPGPPIILLPGNRILSIGNVTFIESTWYSSHFQVEIIEDLGADYLIESSYIIDPYPLFFLALSVVHSSDGGSVVVGRGPFPYGDSPAYGYGLIMKLDQNGDSLWARYYSHGSDGSYHWYNSIVELPDHGFALAGLDEKASGLTQIWVMRVDSMGCLEPGCHLISGLKEQVIGLDGSMKVFPNPVASGQALSLQFKPQGTATMPYNREATRILLYDLQGRLLHEEKIAPKGSNAGFILNLSLPSLATGTYSLHWISEKGVWYDGEQVMVK